MFSRQPSGMLLYILSFVRHVEHIQPLQMIDPRVRVLPWDGYAWSTYRNLEVEGHLCDVEASSWEERTFFCYSHNSISSIDFCYLQLILRFVLLRISRLPFMASSLLHNYCV